MSSHAIELVDVARETRRDGKMARRRYGKDWDAWTRWDRRIAQYVTEVEPSPTNTYPPSWDATGQIIAFVRDPNKFMLNNYCEFRPATMMQGLYLYLDGDQAARVPADGEYDFADGARRPEGQDELAQFRFAPYFCNRKNYPYTLGNMTRAQCPWNLEAAQAAFAMQKAITLRTWRVVTMLETPANWLGNTGDMNVINGNSGYIDTADTTNLAIRKMVNQVVLDIQLGTNGMVTENDLRQVMSPTVAAAAGQSHEMADYVKSSVWAKSTLEGNLFNRNRPYNLPPVLYGVETVVENAVRVSSRKGAATVAKGFIKDSVTPSVVFCAKIKGLPGDQVGPFPTPNFSTFQIFHYGGLLKLVTWTDTRNERLEGWCEEVFDEKIVAPLAGYLVTSPLSTSP
jgi:hypothetical protein